MHNIQIATELSIKYVGITLMEQFVGISFPVMTVYKVNKPAAHSF